MYELQPPAEPGGAWAETVAYSLSWPVFGLLAGPAGSFYVLNLNGGAEFLGDLLQLTPPAAPGGSWTGTDLFDYLNAPSVDVPNSLIAGSAGGAFAVKCGADLQVCRDGPAAHEE